MTISVRPIAYFAALTSKRALRWLFAAAVLAAVAAPTPPTPPGGPGSSERVPMTASECGLCYHGGQLQLDQQRPLHGIGTSRFVGRRRQVRGGIGRGGSVAVTISVGASRASGSGRLVGNSAQAGGAESFPATGAAESGKPRERRVLMSRGAASFPLLRRARTSNGTILIWTPHLAAIAKEIGPPADLTGRCK